jgi:anti-anti-sigma regulatory factor
MAFVKGKPLFQWTVIQGVKVVRFAHPDLRCQVDVDEKGCTLFQQLRDNVLVDLQPGETLVLNFGLIEQFPTAFYSCLLMIRKAVLAVEGKLILCRLSPEHLEVFELFQARRLFNIQRTEAQALLEAGAFQRLPSRW